MNDKTIVYSTYYNPMEANIIRAKLEDSGFDCFLADENLATLNPFYNQAIGGVKLIVFERDAEAIDQLLKEDNNESLVSETKSFPDAGEGEVTCDKCGSKNVSYGMATRKKYSWWVMLISFLTFAYPFKGKKCYHCYNCGYEFE